MPFKPQVNADPKNITDYTFLGAPIVIGKLKGGRPPNRKKKADWYPITVKVHAACLYAVLGNFQKVSDLTNIPASELKSMAGEQWWADTIKEVRKEENDTISAQLTEIATNTITKLMERIVQGDPVLDWKTGNISYVPIKYKDLATALGTIIDKRQILRGDPTSRTERLDQEAVLKALGEKFEGFAKKLENRIEKKAIEYTDIEYTEVKDDVVPETNRGESQKDERKQEGTSKSDEGQEQGALIRG